MKEAKMMESLQPGMRFEFTYTVTDERTVPYLYPDIEEAAVMPKVFATGYMVGLMEFACIRFINPYIEWPVQQTVGVHINVNHTAATPVGMSVTVKGRLEKVDGRKLSFSLEAYDALDKISQGTHDRFIIDAEKFNAAVEKKRSEASAAR
jgi:fluoroacetyl-CoA thioesterase